MTTTAGENETSGPQERRLTRLLTIQRTDIGARTLSAEVVLGLRERIRANLYGTPSVLDELVRKLLLTGDI